MTPRCNLFAQEKPPVFIHLGKYGDEMILMPGWKHLYDETGVRPIVVVARDFESIFDGFSYADRVAVEAVWWRDVAQYRAWAQEQFPDSKIVVPKFWEDPDAEIPQVKPGEDWVELSMPNKKWILRAQDWDSFMTSQWKHAGFPVNNMLEWPLVFDRRDSEREEQLASGVFETDKPKILVSMPIKGTSVFMHCEDIWARILRLWGAFEIVDLAKIRAERIYDLLGLYDRAEFLVTSDTATLHLAGASKISYVAFIGDGGNGSIPRGNCVAAIRYKDAMRNIPRIDRLLEDLYKRATIYDLCNR